VTVVATFGNLCVVFVLACLALTSGTRLLTSLGLVAEGRLEQALYAAGLFFAALEVALFVLATFGWLRQGVVLALLAGAALLAWRAWLGLPKLARAFVGEVRRAGRSPRMSLVVALVLICVAVDFLMAMAPLTGSDAMHYHFTVPMIGLGKPSAPIFWLANSFFVGQGHLLVSLGMALGSDRISLGLIHLGGVLTAAALFVLVRKLAASEQWAWVAVLVFLLTPMVYWQMSTSGSPDIWMAFYTTLVVLAAACAVQTARPRWWALAGIFAGAVAGAKYTGWVVPLALVAGCFFVVRSWRQAALCGLWTLPTGILPLLRNTVWTGDPFFPFLSHWLTPSKINVYTFSAIVADTHSSAFQRSLAGIGTYPFLLALRGSAYGVGEYFGPLVLAFAPLLILAVRKGFLARVAAGIWAALLVSNALTSQMARFLLPAFPLALALVFSGAAESFRRGWMIVRAGCLGTLVLFLLFGLGSEALYARDFIPVVVGLEEQDAFLERMAPDYPATAFINRCRPGPGKVMVFFRHVYYLNPPFIEGDSQNSWLMDPDRLGEPQKLLALLHRENVRWVAKVPDYPELLAPAFQTLEDEGKLRPVLSADVSTFSGFRIYERRTSLRAVILEVDSKRP